VAFVGKADMAARLIDRDGRDLDKIFPESIPAHVIAFGSLGAFAVGGLVLLSRNAPGRATGHDVSVGDGNHDEIFLWLWAIAVLCFGIFATPFLAVRHLLPAVPPLLWLALRRFRETYEGVRVGFVAGVLVATVAVSTVFGYLVAKADYDWANWYRRMATEVASRTVEAGRTRQKEVWYTGHWGWAYYADRVGMKPYIPGKTQMGEGDLLLMPLAVTWQLPPGELKPFLQGLMRPIQPTPKRIKLTGNATVDAELDWCLNSVRSISSDVHLYGSGTVTVPWQFSRKPLEYFGVIEVKRDLPGLGASDKSLPETSTESPSPHHKN
jgi:hypothetical protein